MKNRLMKRAICFALAGVLAVSYCMPAFAEEIENAPEIINYDQANLDEATDDIDGNDSNFNNDEIEESSSNDILTDDAMEKRSSEDLVQTDNDEPILNGDFGNGVTWRATMDNDYTYTLYVEGSGSIPDFSDDYLPPWTQLSINSINICDGITAIGNKAFYYQKVKGCNELNIANSVKRIGDYAFTSGSLFDNKLIIPDGVEEIGEAAFQKFSTKEIEFGSGLKSIGKDAFANNTYLSCELNFPEGLESIGTRAFYKCQNVTGELIIPESVTDIGASAFYYLEKITKIEINSTGKIGNSAFEGCRSVTELVLGKNIKKIGSKAFYACCKLCGTLTIPGNVEIIDSEAFYGIEGDCKLVLCEGINSIGTEAFAGCTGFKYALEIPGSIEKIGMHAFDGCKNIPSLTLHEGIKVISSSAFWGCEGISGKLVIPASMEEISDYAFVNCSGITTLEIRSADDPIDNSSNVEKNEFDNQTESSNEITYTTDSGCKEIRDYAFWNCTSLSKFIIGNEAGSYYLGNHAFLVPDNNSLTTQLVTVNEVFLYYNWLADNRIVKSPKKLDVWQFANVAKYFGKECNGYVISKNDYNMLIKNFSNTIKSWLETEKYTLYPTPIGVSGDNWNGSCEGMARVVCIKNMGIHSMEELGLSGLGDELWDITTADEYYNIGNLFLDSKVGTAESLINFYHLQQHLPKEKSYEAKMIADPEFQYSQLKELGEELKADDSKMGLITFVFNGSGHTVAAYGYRDVASGETIQWDNASNIARKLNIGEYSHCILLYDPTNPLLMADDSCINIYYDDAGNWCVPGYEYDCNGNYSYLCYKNKKFSKAGDCLKMATADADFINPVDYCTGAVNMLDDETVAMLRLDYQSEIVIKTPDAEAEESKGVVSGKDKDIFVAVPDSNTDDNNNSYVTIVLPEAESYAIETNDSPLNFNLITDGYYYAVTGENSGNIEVNESGYINMEMSEAGSAYVEMTSNDGFNSVSADEIYFTGDGIEKISLSKKNDGILIESNSYENANVYIVDNDEYKVLSIDTEKESVQIVKIDDDIVAFTDENNDGVYESTIAIAHTPLSSLELREKVLLIDAGSTFNVAQIIANYDENVKYSFDSSDDSVVTVNDTGLITGVTVGTAIITISADGFIATLEVKVESKYGDILEEDIPEDGVIPEGLWIAGVPIEGYSFTGNVIKPSIRVYDYKTILKEKKDYTISYKNNVNASSTLPTIIIKGAGNYKDTETVTFAINPKNIADTDVLVADIASVLSTNKNQLPVPKVTWGKKTLSSKNDYSVAYYADAECTNAITPKDIGTYYVKLSGKGNYTGDVVKTFTINADNQKLVSKLSVSKIKDKTYTGSPIELSASELVVKDGKITLEAGTHYTVSYSENHTDIGTVSVTITGDGVTYVGSKIVTFKIVGTSLSKAKINNFKSSLPYNGGTPVVQAVTFTCGTQTLLGVEASEYATMQEGDEKRSYQYTYEYQNNTNPGKATVIYKGVNNYTGIVKKTYAISGIALSKAVIDANSFVKSYVYDGNAKTQDAIKLTYTPDKNSSVIKLRKIEKSAYNELSDSDKLNYEYTYEYQNNVKAGTATMVLTGVNMFTGTIKKTYKIEQFDISKDSSDLFKISLTSTSVNYAKSGAKPKPIVTFNGNVLIEGVDYSLGYANNTALNNGTGSKTPTIKVTGKGNFKGSDSTTKFSIVATDIGNCGAKIVAADKVVSTKKGAWKSSITVVDADGKKLTAGRDYQKKVEYTYMDGTPVGDTAPVNSVIKITITGMGGYTNTLDGTYRIVAKDINKITASVDPKTYTGKAVKLTESDIKFMLSKKPLTDVTFEIDESSYKNNVNKGKATVVIKGTGEYGGTKTITYTIGKKGFLWWWRNLSN